MLSPRISSEYVKVLEGVFPEKHPLQRVPDAGMTSLEELMDEQKVKESMDERLEMTLRRELKRAGRHKEPLSLVLIECYIENNEHRKSAFVPLLKQVAALIRNIIRDEDTEIILGRNLLLILPVTFPDGAHIVTTKIQKKLSTTAFKGLEEFPNLRFHLIFGYSHFPNDGTERVELLTAARTSLKDEKKRLLERSS